MVENSFPLSAASNDNTEVYEQPGGDWIFAATKNPGLPMLNSEELLNVQHYLQL